MPNRFHILAYLPFLNISLPSLFLLSSFFLHSSSFLPSLLSSFVSLSLSLSLLFLPFPSLLPFTLIFFYFLPQFSRARTRTYKKLHFLLSQVSHFVSNFFYFCRMNYSWPPLLFRHCFFLVPSSNIISAPIITFFCFFGLLIFKRRLVLLKTTCRFLKNNVSFFPKQRLVFLVFSLFWGVSLNKCLWNILSFYYSILYAIGCDTCDSKKSKLLVGDCFQAHFVGSKMARSIL